MSCDGPAAAAPTHRGQTWREVAEDGKMGRWDDITVNPHQLPQRKRRRSVRNDRDDNRLSVPQNHQAKRLAGYGGRRLEQAGREDLWPGLYFGGQ